jgi:hypothetical protein
VKPYQANFYAIRIRDNLKLETLYQWPNPPFPKPIKDPNLKFQKAQQKLNKDRKAFKNACIQAGL